MSSNILKPALLRFVYDDFENIAKSATASRTDHRGNAWSIDLYPRGRGRSRPRVGDGDNERDVHLNVSFLAKGRDGSAAGSGSARGSPTPVERTAIFVRDASGGIYHDASDEDDEGVGTLMRGFGWILDLKRSDILEEGVLRDGSLVLDLEVQYGDGGESYSPPNPAVNNMRNLLDAGTDADAWCKAGDDAFPVHLLILKMNAPLLHAFCKDSSPSEPARIDNISGRDLRCVLRYVYSGEPEESACLGSEDMKGIIGAANRFSLVELKIALETTLVQRRILTADNVVEWLLFADAVTCPYLKEYATAFFVARTRDVVAREEYGRLKESPALLTELLLVLSDDARDVAPEGGATVDELRRKLAERGEDVDGTKEVLEARWATIVKGAKKRRRTGGLHSF